MKRKSVLKFITLSVALWLCQTVTNQTNAQGLYVHTGLGYNLSAGSMALGFNSIESGTNTTETIVNGSFGKGLNFGLGIGYMFSANVGAELGFSMLMGSKYTFTDTHSGGTSTETAKGKMFRVTPAIKITAGDKIKPYAKFGVVAGLIPKIDYTRISSSDPVTKTVKYSGGTSIGWMGALGMDFNFSSMIGIFVELNTISQSWAPTKYEDSHAYLGTDPTTFEPIYGPKTTTLVKTINDNSVDQELQGHYPFSSFGINIGLKISFGGGGDAAAK